MPTKNLDIRFIITLIAAIIFAALFLFTLLTSGNKGIADPDSVQKKIGHMGEVIDYEVIPSTGLTAWKIKPDGLDRQFIFYSTPNGKALLTGSIWDAETGSELSEGIKLVQDAMNYNMEAGITDNEAAGNPIEEAQQEETPAYAATDGNGEALGEYDGEIPIIFDLLGKMKGFTQGDSSRAIQDTIFVFYDPRCPICREAHDAIDKYDLDAKGISVKWMPTVALGDDDVGRKRAAMAFQASDYNEFSESITGNLGADSISEEERQYLSDNLQVLKTATEETYGSDFTVKVPAAIYLNKETGMPKLLFGISEEKPLKTIFGE